MCHYYVSRTVLPCNLEIAIALSTSPWSPPSKATVFIRLLWVSICTFVPVKQVVVPFPAPRTWRGLEERCWGGPPLWHLFFPFVNWEPFLFGTSKQVNWVPVAFDFLVSTTSMRDKTNLYRVSQTSSIFGADPSHFSNALCVSICTFVPVK
jgi:hypothetical protein